MSSWALRSDGKALDRHALNNNSQESKNGSIGRSRVPESCCHVEDASQTLSGRFFFTSGNRGPVVKRSELQETSEETAQSDQVTWRQRRTVPPQAETTEAIELLASWPKVSKSFSWMRCKGEVLCAFSSFNLLLVIIVAGYLITGKQKFLLILPWLVTTVGSILLLGTLFKDYAGSQTTCFYSSPILFLMAFFSWFIPNVSCKSGAIGGWCEPGRHSSEIIGLLVSISLPWLLTAAPMMAWQASCLLSVAIPSLFLSTLIAQNIVTKSTPQIMIVPLIVLLLMATNVALWYLRSWKSSKILSMIDTWGRAFEECKSHEEQVLGLLEEKEKENADKISKMRQFISYIFHEIRVPFNAVVLGIGHMLAGDVSDEQREILKMMDSSSSSMIRILNDVLDMGKIEAGKLHLEKQPFNMAEMVSSLIWAFKDTLDSKGIDFSLCIDHDTKELLSKHDLLGDKHRVRQVLANYLSNATKFTPRGGKVSLRVCCNGTFKTDTPHLSVEQSPISAGSGSNCEDLVKSSICSLEGENFSSKNTQTVASITVSVEDTGIGISKEDQARLFEPYIQISAGSSQGGGGTGLGLSFSKRIVELAGGKIGVFSEVGKGSVFLFTMPFKLVERSSKDRDREAFQSRSGTQTGAACPLSRSSSLSSLSERPRRNPRVLIVEDNLVNRKILRKLLESFNVESDDAEDGKQAVELCRERGTYDMILIDKDMPVMDGHEATRKLRAMGIKSPIVGLTGNALDSDRNQFLAAGVDDFFTKPISRHQLVKLLEAYGLIVQSRDKTSLSSLSLPSTIESRLLSEECRR